MSFVEEIENLLSRHFNNLSYTTEILSHWHPLLHTLAKGTRANLMTALGYLAPAIQEMGGAEALRGIVDEMQRICRQWK